MSAAGQDILPGAGEGGEEVWRQQAAVLLSPVLSMLIPAVPQVRGMLAVSRSPCSAPWPPGGAKPLYWSLTAQNLRVEVLAPGPALCLPRIAAHRLSSTAPTGHKMPHTFSRRINQS